MYGGLSRAAPRPLTAIMACVFRSWLKTVLAVSTATTLLACSTAPPADGPAPPAADAAVPALDRAGWTDTVYQKLTETIAASAGQNKIVVFDFDNTTLARDIGEAVLANAQQSRALDGKTLPSTLFPSFSTSTGKQVSVGDGIFDYYEAVMDSGGDADPFREFSSLPMPGSAFQGRTIADFLAQTAAVYDNGSGAGDLASGKQSSILSTGRPFIYPQMADLYGNLRRNGYDVWIVSAGISWAVRWMVQNALNPAIVDKYGAEAALPLDRVVAVSMLIKDRNTGQLVSDYQLTHRDPDPAYINLEPVRMSQLEITALPGGLTSWRGGKVGAIADVISRGELFMVAGDSMGDVEMLTLAPNRLVVSRMNKPDLAEGFAKEITDAPQANWMVQPTINSAPVGFLTTKCEMAQKTAGDAEVAATANKSLASLEGTGRLGSFVTC
jgi:phosphoserine phosphatase